MKSKSVIISWLFLSTLLILAVALLHNSFALTSSAKTDGRASLFENNASTEINNNNPKKTSTKFKTVKSHPPLTIKGIK